MKHIHFLPTENLVKMFVSQGYPGKIDLTLMLPIYTPYTLGS